MILKPMHIDVLDRRTVVAFQRSCRLAAAPGNRTRSERGDINTRTDEKIAELAEHVHELDYRATVLEAGLK